MQGSSRVGEFKSQQQALLSGESPRFVDLLLC